MYISGNLKDDGILSYTFRLGLENVSLSIGIDNGQEEKNLGTYIFFTAVWNGVQIYNRTGSE